MAETELVLTPPQQPAVEIIKRGETSLTISLIRSAGGLTVSVKAHPQVEAFMRGLGNGEHVDVKAAGPYWRTISRDPDSRLYVYNQTTTVESVMLDNGDQANVNRPGQALLDQQFHGDTGKTKRNINLSFLRLVGISEDAGVTFAVRGVHTYEALVQMQKQLGTAYKRFYKTYIHPIKVDIVISTQLTSLPIDETVTRD